MGLGGGGQICHCTPLSEERGVHLHPCTPPWLRAWLYEMDTLIFVGFNRVLLRRVLHTLNIRQIRLRISGKPSRDPIKYIPSFEFPWIYVRHTCSYTHVSIIRETLFYFTNLRIFKKNLKTYF